MFGVGEFGQYQPRRPLRTLTIALALLLTVALAWVVRAALLSPGEVIRGELEAAAAEVHATLTLAGPSETVLRRLGRYFPHRTVTVEARSRSLVVVTLHRLDAGTCRETMNVARRMEGLVVVELENFRAASECGESNDMTWRIMP
jgi:hypothetical protein